MIDITHLACWQRIWQRLPAGRQGLTDAGNAIRFSQWLTRLRRISGSYPLTDVRLGHRGLDFLPQVVDGAIELDIALSLDVLL